MNEESHLEAIAPVHRQAGRRRRALGRAGQRGDGDHHLRTRWARCSGRSSDSADAPETLAHPTGSTPRRTKAGAASKPSNQRWLRTQPNPTDDFETIDALLRSRRSRFPRAPARHRRLGRAAGAAARTPRPAAPAAPVVGSGPGSGASGQRRRPEWSIRPALRRRIPASRPRRCRSPRCRRTPS